MPTLINAFFAKRVEQLFDLAETLDKALSSTGIDYRVVGGLATYLYVEELQPEAGRLTRGAGLITAEMEANLSPILHERLARARARE